MAAPKGEQLSVENREAAPESFEQQVDEYPATRMSPEQLRTASEQNRTLSLRERERLSREVIAYMENRDNPTSGNASRSELPEAPVRYAPAKPEGAITRGLKFLASPAVEVVHLFNGTVRAARNIIETGGSAIGKIFGATGHVAEKTGIATGKVIGAVGHVTEKTGGAAGELIEETGKLGGETLRRGTGVVREGGGIITKTLETGKNITEVAAKVTKKIADIIPK